MASYGESARKLHANGNNCAASVYQAFRDVNTTGDSKAPAPTVKEADVDHGALHMSGYMCPTITVSTDNACHKLDLLAEVIHKGTYEGRSELVWDMLDKDDFGEDDTAESATSEPEKIGNVMSSLLDEIKIIADRTINKEPGVKIHRYKGAPSEVNNSKSSDDSSEGKVRVLNRDYDVTADKIKGIDKIEHSDIEHFKLTRYIALVDETCYTVREDGNAELTRAAQEEYDDFVQKIRQEMQRDGIQVIDEGYGEGEDELEWHLTACIMKADEDDAVGCVLEIDTCIRTEEPEES